MSKVGPWPEFCHFQPRWVALHVARRVQLSAPAFTLLSNQKCVAERRGGEPARCSGAAYIHKQRANGCVYVEFGRTEAESRRSFCGHGCQLSSRSSRRELHYGRATCFSHPVSCVCETRYRQYKNWHPRRCEPLKPSEISRNVSHVAPTRAMGILENLRERPLYILSVISPLAVITT